MAQQAPLHPFQHHVKAAAILLGEDLNDLGMVQGGANRFLPLKAVEEDRVAFHLEVREFDGYDTVGGQIGGAINGGHAAGGDDAIDPVVIEHFAGTKGNQLRRECAHTLSSYGRRHK